VLNDVMLDQVSQGAGQDSLQEARVVRDCAYLSMHAQLVPLVVEHSAIVLAVMTGSEDKHRAFSNSHNRPSDRGVYAQSLMLANRLLSRSTRIEVHA
jgi:hypothetical protein